MPKQNQNCKRSIISVKRISSLPLSAIYVDRILVLFRQCGGFFPFHHLIFIYYFYIVYVLHNAHLHSMKISKYETCLINCLASDSIMLSILLSFKVYFVVVHSSSSYITLTVIVLLKFEYHENPIFLYIFCI